MLRLYDIPYQDTTTVTFTTEEIETDEIVPYVVYDTSTGYTTLQDYYSWRACTVTSTGMTGSSFAIGNSNLYPKFGAQITDYSILTKGLFYIMSFSEHYILMHLKDRLDLVRKRLPNPGTFIEDVDGMGDRGVVSVAGGYYKKFSVEEMMRFVEGTLIEVNIHPPATPFYWDYTSLDSELVTNPYNRNLGVPYKLLDLIVQGSVIRALVSWGILEIDLNFSTSDAGLQITYDKVNPVASWMDRLLAEYTKQKDLTKWDFANHAGIGVGSLPYEATGVFGVAMNNIQQGGTLALSSMLGFNVRTNTPL